MTITERNQKLKYYITCLKCEVSGKVCDDNCPTQYEAGNMGEIIENLEGISKILEQEPVQVELEGDGYADGFLVYDYGKCPKCGWQYEEGDKDWKEPFCCHCGQKLKWFNQAESEEV